MAEHGQQRGAAAATAGERRRRARQAGTQEEGHPALGLVNEVRLSGRVSGAPQERVLADGGEAVVFRLLVPREPTAAGRAPAGDLFDCVVVGAARRKQVLRWTDGLPVEVGGVLQRRFWRAGGRTVARCEVRVDSARRVR